MSNYSKTWIYGLGSGLLIGIPMAIVVAVSNPNASFWMLAEDIIAWTVMGWVVISSSSGLKPIMHGVMITVFLNLPWYIQFAILPGRWDHLPFMIVMTMIIGLIFGFVKKRII